MLRTTKNMKEKYEEIQTYLFSLIPEKWEAIYLYASVMKDADDKQTGELFFYYLPKGFLKKKPINVYEVPDRFNINENQYLEVVKKLYNSIKSLRQDFVDTEQELWSSLTISILNFKFKIEYSYDDLPLDEEENHKRHVIWRYKYLKIGGEKKEERRILDEYFSNPKNETKTEFYEAGLYLKNENNRVIFDKEDIKTTQEKVVIYEKDDENIETDEQEEEKKDLSNNKEEIIKSQEENKEKQKNQILNM